MSLEKIKNQLGLKYNSEQAYCEQAYPLIVKLYLLKVPDRNQLCLFYSSKFGHVRWVEFLLKSNPEDDIKKGALYQSFRSGYVRIAELLLNSRAALTNEAMWTVVGYGHMTILNLLISKGYQFDDNDIECAAEYGNLQTFKLVLKHKRDNNYDLSRFFTGDFRNKQYPVDGLIKYYEEAVRGNNPDIIRYLDSLGVRIPHINYITYSDKTDIWTVNLIIQMGFDPKEVVRELKRGNENPKLLEAVTDLYDL